MGTDSKYTGMGGRQPTGLGDVLQVSDTGGSYIWVREVGSDPPHGMGTGKFP